MIIKIINNNETNSTSLLCAYILVLVKAKPKGTTLLFVKISLVYYVLKVFENQNNLQLESSSLAIHYDSCSTFCHRCF